MSEQPFELKIDLNALNHLGINLYSNVPAVLSELIANAWDADAGEVHIDIKDTNDDGKIVSIRDDGCGMNREDMQGKFLTVGYERRKSEEEDLTSGKKRKVMGRKGIGKLSIFSIAEYIEIYTKKESSTIGLTLILQDIKKSIQESKPYQPMIIKNIPNEYEIRSETGTTIVLKDLKKRILSSLGSNLKKRIARRFEIWSDDFTVHIDKTLVEIADRDYFNKMEYVRIYGGYGQQHFNHLDQEMIEENDGNIGDSYLVKGWIGFVKESGSLQEKDDNLNKIPIMVRNKIALEDILSDFREGGMYTKFLIGELQADFLDTTEEDDISTSSRQDFLRTDERFIDLKDFVKKQLKYLEKQRVSYKTKKATEEAQEIPQVKKWLEELEGDSRDSAKKLFGKINSITTDEEHKKTLYKYGILAFETLRHRDKLSKLENTNVENIEETIKIISELDSIEAFWYHQITKSRIKVIKVLSKYHDENVLEKAVQEHIYKHLWLIDPSWDRATETPHMEKTVRTIFSGISGKVKEDSEESKGRLDIQYKKSSGKHVIIELKRSNVSVSSIELISQVEKYIKALRNKLKDAKEDSNKIETICLVGKELSDWDDPDRKRESEAMLLAKNIRVVTYQQLIKEAEISYQNYIDASRKIGYLQEVLDAIDAMDQET